MHKRAATKYCARLDRSGTERQPKNSIQPLEISSASDVASPQITQTPRGANTWGSHVFAPTLGVGGNASGGPGAERGTAHTVLLAPMGCVLRPQEGQGRQLGALPAKRSFWTEQRRSWTGKGGRGWKRVEGQSKHRSSWRKGR